jgi:NAD(P)-dependent dehydrogenase (short-subunit alcohol dehydrogenase family)
MRFKDKSIIITGGDGKIAKAYATAFTKEGAKLSLPDIASADPLVKVIRDIGGMAISMACDVSDEQSVKAMVAAPNSRSLKRSQVETDLIGTGVVSVVAGE